MTFAKSLNFSEPQILDDENEVDDAYLISRAQPHAKINWDNVGDRNYSLQSAP